MSRSVDLRDAIGVDLLVPSDVSTNRRLELVASRSERHDLVSVGIAGEDLALNDQLPSLDERATLPEDAAKRVVVTKHHGHRRRQLHRSHVDHDRLTAPALANLRAGVGDDPELLASRCRIAFGGLQKLDAGIQFD